MSMGLGIDVGTSQTVIASSAQDAVLCEPSVIAVDSRSGKVLAVGAAAKAMLGRNPDSVQVIRPVRKGVIADFEYAEAMIRHFVRRVCTYKVLRPATAVTVPAAVTAVEERSLVDAVSAAGVCRVTVVDKSMAALIGTGADTTRPCGRMVVDIGAGTTDITVMSLSGVAASHSIRAGGDDLDEAIVRYVRGKYNLVIGIVTAETVKNTIGGALARTGDVSMEVKGRHAFTGLPSVCRVTAQDVKTAMEDILRQILSAVQLTFERTSPDLAGDVLRHGIVLTGGVSQMYGLAERLSDITGVTCRVAAAPQTCAALGAYQALTHRKEMAHSVHNASQFDRPDELWR